MPVWKDYSVSAVSAVIAITVHSPAGIQAFWLEIRTGWYGIHTPQGLLTLRRQYPETAMGRYRAPVPKSSPYITREGYNALEEELKALWKHRAEVTRALAAAAAEGDRSENAEYIYRKKELHGIDRRIRYLQKRLPDLRVVTGPPTNPDRVFFGAWVTLEDEKGRNVTYRIVGPDEFDQDRNWISMDSPMAMALMQKSQDEEATVQAPGGNIVYLIVDIRYQP